MATATPTTDEPADLKSRLAALEAENEQLRAQLAPDPTNRAIKAGGLLAGVPALSLLFGSASAQSGTIPASGDSAFTKFRGDRLRLVPRSSAVSSPDDGVVTYRGDL